jgi:nucleotide-binding universal stress UspA family protein
MFENVLVGVDGRTGGQDAIALAARLTDPSGKLTLAHVHSGPLYPSRAITPGLLDEERAASVKLLEHERDSAGLDAELLSLVAISAGRSLHEQAEEQHADLIVVGSCHRGAFGRAMLGDDTRGALNGAPCAVAVAAGGYAEHPKPFASIGVAYNRSPESEAALAVARQLAAPTRADVQALEVVALQTYAYTGLIPPAIGQSIEELLNEANNHMRELPEVHGHAVCGLTGEELAAFGATLDLLVVGSRGYGPLKRLILGSTSDYLERHARCSLLVLPRGASSDVPASEQPAAEERLESSV